MSRKKQKQPHNRSPTQMNSMNSMSKIIINNLFWIKINFRSSMQLALLALRVRKKTIYSSYFLLNKHAHIHTQCKKWKRNGMEVHVHAEKKDGEKLKLRQFFIDASERERCWTTTRKRILQEEEDENSAKWKYWKMHFAQKWWTRKNGKGKLVCIERERGRLIKRGKKIAKIAR